MIEEAVEREPRNFDGSRIFQEDREHRKNAQWVDLLSRSQKGVSIERISVEDVEKRFFKKGKTQRDECNKQAINQTSKRHIKLLKLNST